jgi:TRAP-type mannitol/chloroaromatic compound transport system permease small subunit
LTSELAHQRTALPQTRLSRRIDAAVRRVGDAVSWVWVVLLLVIVANVTLRYVFGAGRIEFEELQWHLFSVGFLTALAYGLESDDHVRVDFLHERFSLRIKAWVDFYGLLLLFFPFVALVMIYAVPFAVSSFESAEISSSAGGLPFRWLLKGTLLGAFTLLGVAGFSRLLRVSALLFGAPEPLADPRPE